MRSDRWIFEKRKNANEMHLIGFFWSFSLSLPLSLYLSLLPFFSFAVSVFVSVCMLLELHFFVGSVADAKVMITLEQWLCCFFCSCSCSFEVVIFVGAVARCVQRITKKRFKWIELNVAITMWGTQKKAVESERKNEEDDNNGCERSLIVW